MKMWTLERGVVNNLADLRAKNLTRLGWVGGGGESPEAALLCRIPESKSKRHWSPLPVTEQVTLK